MRHSQSLVTSKILVHAFIANRVNWCNSLLCGIPAYTIRRLRAVMHATAWLVDGTNQFNHITFVLRDVLHWLSAQQRTEYKMALLIFKSLHGIEPELSAQLLSRLSADILGHNLHTALHGNVYHS